MQRLGTVERIAQGLAIVRVGDPPELGSDVVDEQLDVAGCVVDVFGPTARPYVAISPASDRHLPSLLGEKLYVR